MKVTIEELTRLKKRRAFAVEKFRGPTITIVITAGWMDSMITLCNGTYKDYLKFSGERIYYKRKGRVARMLLPILDLLEGQEAAGGKFYTLTRDELFAALGVNDG